MGIDVYVESEDGEATDELLDLHNLTWKIVRFQNESTSCCLRFIDPYGDTTFNQLQLPVVVSELQHAIDNATDPAVKSHGEGLMALALKASSEVHTYLKFYGD